MKNLIAFLLAMTVTPALAARNIPLDTAQFSRQSGAPSSPIAGTTYGYVLDSDGKFYIKNSSGTAKACVYSGDAVNADFSAGAALDFSKLAALASGNILVGSAGNVATSVAVSGDISMSNAGATAYVGTVPLNKGGTGQTTKAAAFDALQPMSASGDIIYGGASGTGTRLAKGSDGQVLKLASGVPTWAAESGGGGGAVESAQTDRGSDCGSTPCTLITSTPGVTSITRSATGTYTINFSGGVFSEAPTCTCIGYENVDSATGAAWCAPEGTPSATAVTFYISSTVARRDGRGIRVTCIGE